MSLASNIAKGAGIVTRSAFDSKESQLIMLCMNKLPKFNVIKTSLLNFDGNLSEHHVEQILRMWPKSVSLEDLEGEVLTNKEIWSKAEAYMLQFNQLKSTYGRLKMLDFHSKWDKEKEPVVEIIVAQDKLYA